ERSKHREVQCSGPDSNWHAAEAAAAPRASQRAAVRRRGQADPHVVAGHSGAVLLWAHLPRATGLRAEHSDARGGLAHAGCATGCAGALVVEGAAALRTAAGGAVVPASDQENESQHPPAWNLHAASPLHDEMSSGRRRSLGQVVVSEPTGRYARAPNRT